MKKKFKIIIVILVAATALFTLTTYHVLKNTPELNIHQMRGAVNNKVYISKDGHKEAVYDNSGKLVTDPVNMGSYNYSHPSDEPFGHFVNDMLPWIMWGNSKDDPTSISERLSAYSKDLYIGLLFTIGLNNK